MCIIAFKPSGAAMPSRDILENCFLNNPDGAGYAIKRAGGKSVYYSKGFFTFAEFYAAISAEKITPADVVGLHFRIATNGAVKSKNCHPFFVSNDAENVYSTQGVCKSVIFHNGILSKKYSYDKKISDTCLFTLALAKKEKSLIAKNALSSFIEKETEGNRILYIHADIEKPILSGNWIEDKETGCFFSNNSYSYSYAYAYKGFSDYAGKYGGKWYSWEKGADTGINVDAPDFNMCPYCGETVNIKQISHTYDLWECDHCAELFDSYGNYIELKYYEG